MQTTTYKLEQTILRQRCVVCHREYELSEEKSSCSADGSMLSPVFGDPFVGTIFDDKYRIIELIAIGGTSKIYKAKHLTLDRDVALKVLQGGQEITQAQIRRFQREAQAAIGLVHPNIVRVYDFGVSPQPYIVMEYIQGKTLAKLVQEKSAIAIDCALPYFVQISEAMSQAHRAGLIHRDLKPSNVIVDEESNEAKVIDFGLVKDFVDDTQHTRTGEMLGSPAYMSPEQCKGEELDARSDIYSLGCVIYEVLTGKAAFSGDSVVECMFKHLEGPVPSIKKALSGFKHAGGLDRTIANCLAKEPEQRYQSMEELRKDLVTTKSGHGRRVKSRQKVNKSKLVLRALQLTMLAVALTAVIVPAYREMVRPNWDRLLNDGAHRDMRGDSQGAVALLLRAKLEAEAAHAPERKLEEIYGWLGGAYVWSNRCHEGKDALEKALKLNLKHEENADRAHYNRYLAWAYRGLKNYVKELEHAQIALDVARRQKIKRVQVAACLYEAGRALYWLGRTKESLEPLLQARQILDNPQDKDDGLRINVETMLGHAYAQQSCVKEALDAYGNELALSDKLNKSYLVGHTKYFADTFCQTDIDRVLAEIAGRYHWSPFLKTLVKGRILLKANRCHEAIESLRQSKQMTVSLKGKDSTLLGKIDLLLADAYSQLYDDKRARKVYAETLMVVDELDRHERFEAAGNIATIFTGQDGAQAINRIAKQYHWPPSLTALVTGRYLLHLQQCDQAIDVLSKAIKTHLDKEDLYFSRGWVYFVVGKLELARQDWQKFEELTDWYANHATVLMNLAYRFEHKPQAAKRALTEFSKKVHPGWPYQAIQYLRGHINSDKLLKSAGKNRAYITEAKTYIGTDLLLKGKRSESRKYFLWVIEHGCKGMPEYDLSVVLLNKLSNTGK